MKVMHISDLHIGKKVHEFSLINDQKYILEQIISIIKSKGVTTLIIAGDVYDKVVPSVEAVKLFDWFLNELVILNINVIIISGNHDSNERLAFMSSIVAKNNIYITDLYNNSIKNIEIDGVTFHMFPFLKPKQVKKYDENINDYHSMMEYLINSCELGAKNIAVVHQFLTGSKTSDSEEISIGGIDNISSTLFKDFDYTALGHLHRPQKVGSENIRYSGSILKYSFSECSDTKSCVIINTDDFTYTLEPLIPMRDMLKIKGKYEDIIKKEYYDSLNLENYYQITLTNEEDVYDALNKLRVIYKNIMKLTYDNKRSREVNVIGAKKNMEPLDFVNELYKLQNNNEINSDQQSYVTNMLNDIWGNK